MQLVIHSPYRQPASTAPGAWRCASASAASSISSSRRPRPKTRSSSRSPRRTASRSTRWRAICTRRRCATCSSRRCSIRRCSRRAGAGSPACRWRCRASAAAGRCRRSSQRMARRGPDRRGVSRPGRLRREPAGEREIPDHPLVRQAHRRLPDRGDGHRRPRAAAEGDRVGRGSGRRARPHQPSPLALEVLTARPYAYLDDAPLEERRTQAVMARRWMSPQDAADLGRLDAEAIARVREEAWPDAENADEMHDALVWLGFLTEAEVAAGDRLARMAATSWRRTKRAGRDRRRRARDALDRRRAAAAVPRRFGRRLATEPAITAPAAYRDKEMVARRGAGRDRARPAGRPGPGGDGRARARRSACSAERSPRRSRRSRPKASRCAAASRRTRASDEWCERRLLARIHRYTIKRLRAEIEPVAARDFLRFLFSLAARRAGRADGRAERRSTRSSASSKASRRRLPRGRSEILPARVADYDRTGSTTRASPGHVAWMRLRARDAAHDGERRRHRCAPRRSRCCRAAMPRLWRALSLHGRRGRRPSARAQAVARLHPRSTAPRSSTSCCSRLRPAALAARGSAGRAGGARAS